ncbi:MAG: tRNA pseudouridine(55) synthase TruB, partial [Treponema sp.]|nr:tRNA pseudouridine(55) synthase TruB [Treponema sp.]
MGVSVPSGLVLLNKKKGITSFEALHAVKRAIGSGKAGHTGTLDKFAQGLLLVLTGGALKLSPWFSHADKQYLGRIRFGIETDTLDPEGSPVAAADLPSLERVENALSQFTGLVMQEPPAYSAIHVGGKRASALARSGEAPAMKKRPVHIYKLELRAWEPPFADIFVHCASGAYIRSLARDVALAAGSRAHLSALTRARVAGFSLEDAWDGEGELVSRPLNKDVFAALGISWFDVAQDEAHSLFHGRPLSPILEGIPLQTRGEEGLTAAIFSCGSLAAIVENKNGK